MKCTVCVTYFISLPQLRLTKLNSTLTCCYYNEISYKTNTILMLKTAVMLTSIAIAKYILFSIYPMKMISSKTLKYF